MLCVYISEKSPYTDKQRTDITFYYSKVCKKQQKLSAFRLQFLAFGVRNLLSTWLDGLYSNTSTGRGMM